MQVKASGTHAVGKVVGDNVYVHRSALEKSAIPVDVVDKRAEHLPKNFDFQIIKWNRRSGDVSFLKSPGRDTSPEPLVGDGYKVNADGTVKFPRHRPRRIPSRFITTSTSSSPPITASVNVAESRAAITQKWEALRYPTRRASGYKKYWDREVVTPTTSERALLQARKRRRSPNHTARAHGAVGGKAIVPRYVERETSPQERAHPRFRGRTRSHPPRHLRRRGVPAALAAPSLAATCARACTIPRPCRWSVTRCSPATC